MVAQTTGVAKDFYGLLTVPCTRMYLTTRHRNVRRASYEFVLEPLDFVLQVFYNLYLVQNYQRSQS